MISIIISSFGAIILSIIATALYAMLEPRVSIRKKKRSIDTILKFTNNDTRVILPIRSGELDDDFATKLESNRYVTLEEALTLTEIQEILEETKGVGYHLESSMINPDKIDATDNLICIGGPMATKVVAGYFNNGKPLDRIDFRWTRKNEKKRMANYRDFIYEADEEIIDGIKMIDNEMRIGKKIFRYDLHNLNKEKREGYVFLARLTGEEDFSDKDHGTVHIIFGNNSDCTLAALKVLVSRRKALIQKINENKRFGHYVFLIKCRLTSTGAEVNFNEFYDFTDACFGGKQ